MMRAGRILLVVLLLVTGVHAGENPTANPDELDIAEAVFRYQMAQPTDYQMGTNPAAFYLGFKDGDPPRELLGRFANHTPPVKEQSDIERTKEMVVRDWRTKKLGIHLLVRTIKRVTETHASVEAGHYENGKSASDYVYEVEKEDGRWMVVSRKLISIS